MKINNIVIIIIPDDAYGEITTAVPSLGVGVISGYLSAHGYDHEIRDLFREIWVNPSLMLHTELFHDKSRVLRYAGGGKDEELDIAAGRLLGGTSISDGTVFGFSTDMAPYFSRFGALLALARYVKSKCECVTVAGGLVYNDFFSDFVQSGFLDFAVSSIDVYSLSGHHSFVELLGKIESDDKDYSGISGLIYKDGPMVRTNEHAATEPFYPPDFSRFNLEMYATKIPGFFVPGESASVKMLPFRFTAGCRCNCAYCYMSRFKELKILDSAEIVSQLKSITETTGCSNFIFMNPCINTHRDFTLRLAHELINSGLDINWSDCAMFENMDRELIEALAKSGCKRLYFGFESLTRNINRYVTKKLDLPHIINVMKLCGEYGIWVGLDVITGFPYETRDEVVNLAEFIRKHAKLIDSVTINKFMLFLHTKFYTEAAKFKILPQPTPLLDAVGGVPFSEINGRDRAKLSEDAEWGYRLLQNAVNESLGYCNDSDMLPILFWMYTKYVNKDEIRKHYGDVIKRCQAESDVKKPVAGTRLSTSHVEAGRALEHRTIVTSDKPSTVKIIVRTISDGACPVKHMKSQVFFVEGGRTPFGMCVAAYESMSKDICEMAYEKNENIMSPKQITCSGCFGKVMFELSVITEKKAAPSPGEKRQRGAVRSVSSFRKP